MPLIDPEHPPLSRLLAKLLRTLLARDAFDTLADLTDALKTECARLKIRWTPDAISDAYALLASNRPLVTPIRHLTRIRPLERLDAVRPLSRAEAADLCARLGVALGRARPAPGGRDARS